MRKDKEKVLDEVWTEDRVRSFLQVRSHDNTPDDFHMLLKAYQSMKPEDFALFVGFFADENRNFNATDAQGRTVLSVLKQHRNAQPYIDALGAASA